MPVIFLKKVNNAVELFEILDAAQDEFNEAFNELNEAEVKKFCEITGATIHSQKQTKESQ